MEGLRGDNEMSGKCTRARWLKLFTRKGREQRPGIARHSISEQCLDAREHRVYRKYPSLALNLAVFQRGEKLHGNFTPSLNYVIKRSSLCAAITSTTASPFRCIVCLFYYNPITNLHKRKRILLTSSNENSTVALIVSLTLLLYWILIRSL